MSDQIAQIQASYNAIEDRILLKITTLNQHVYSAWITRRYLKLLIPALQGQHPQTGEALFTPKPQDAHSQSRQEETALEDDLTSEQPSTESLAFPLGEEPVLLTKISFKDLEGEHPQLNLEPEEGPGIGFPFDAEVLAILLHVVKEAMQSANWNLELEPILELPDSRRLQ